MPIIESISVNASCPSTPMVGQNTTISAGYSYTVLNDSSESIHLTLNGLLSDSANVIRAEFTRFITVPPNSKAQDSFSDAGAGKYDQPGWITVTSNFSITGDLSESTSASCTFRVTSERGPEFESLA